jgi:hypothetical protein
MREELAFLDALRPVVVYRWRSPDRIVGIHLRSSVLFHARTQRQVLQKIRSVHGAFRVRSVRRCGGGHYPAGSYFQRFMMCRNSQDSPSALP